MFHSILFVQRGKEKLCSLNQPQHTSPEPEYFIGFKESPFSPPLLSQDCFLHPSFECKWCHWVGAAASCPQAWHSTGQESCSSAVIWPVQHSQGESCRQANSSTKHSHGQDFPLFSANPPSWGLISYSGHTGVRAASALLLPALWQSHSYSFNSRKATAECLRSSFSFLSWSPQLSN